MSNTPLMQAVASENLELLKVLLESKITTGINAFFDAAEITPLVLAIQKQNVDLIKMLLDGGAKDAINVPVKVLDASVPPVCVVKTPLQCAIDAGNLDVVKLLLENGAVDSEASSA
ncbi:MAG: ankyrin repeat domain-containing protein [Holosporales bacterium]|jgi:ankyrin repeat protein|nr:ankyrin repeat domain-containing protein [Holosporales bacterium]